jgi:integrase
MRAKRITLTETKNNDIRYIPLNDAALSALELARDVADDSGYVFKAAKTSRDYSQGGKWFDRALVKAGITDFTWHCLRHTFASRLVMAGVDLRTVQQLTGHRSIQLTVRYSHLAPAHELAAVQRLTAIPLELEKGGGEKREYLN